MKEDGRGGANSGVLWNDYYQYIERKRRGKQKYAKESKREETETNRMMEQRKNEIMLRWYLVALFSFKLPKV